MAAPQPGALPIDFPTALRLAGADNFEVLLAREKVKEAHALHDEARLRLFPWLSAGFAYSAHDGNVQDVAGAVFEADKQSYSAGLGLNAELNLGESLYQALAARRMARAAEEDERVSRQDAVYLAAIRYFDLTRTAGGIAAAAEAVRIAEEYARQVQLAVDAGLAFKGEVFRTVVQVQRNRTLHRQMEEQRRVAAARLAETLHLEPSTDLILAEPESMPLRLVETNAAMGDLVARALSRRPEVARTTWQARAAEAEHKGTTWGPWVPTLGAQAYFGGLGGGADDHLGRLGRTEDYLLGLSWRIGPSGLFDRGRTRASESRRQSSLLVLERERLEIQREVVEALARCRSISDQVGLLEQSVTAAEELLRLSRERKEFGVGAVLETIQAEQEFTRARLDYVQAVADFNKAQYALKRAVAD